MGHVETEIKLKVSGPEAARAALRKLGAAPVRPRHLQVNVLWDDPKGSLRARGCVLRVRTTTGPAVLTFKGPREEEEGVKAREEIETTVGDAQALEAILGAAGFRPVFRYEKYRETYRWRDAEIVVDETPIGSYLEVEGPATTIHAAAQALGYTQHEYVTASYPALFVAAGGQGDMVFR